jgi:hypothetical protein
MSKFSIEQRCEIIRKSRELVRERDDVAANRAGAPNMVYKTRDDALVADEAPVATDAVSVQPDASTWSGWVEQLLEERFAVENDVVGTVIGEQVADLRAHFSQEIKTLKRGVRLLRRELGTLRDEVGIERGLRDVRSDLMRLHKGIPKLPEIEARLEAEQARLRRELDATKDRLGKVRVDQSIADFKLSKLVREQAAAPKTEVEFETSTSRFVMRNFHPEAAQTLRQFASEVIDARDGGAVWFPNPVGNA